MSDLSVGGTLQSVSWPILNRAWFSKCSSKLTGKRGGFQALLWAAMVNLMLFGLFLLCATPVYETNDDLMMQMIASGFYTGQPDGHLVFTNILIGWTLRFLYGTWAGCNWYFIYLLAVHYAALTAIAFLVVSRRGGWFFTLLYAGFFLIVELRVLLHLQFTTTAFLAGTAGVLLLADGLQSGHATHWPKVVAGVAFAGLMCLIREPASLLLAGIACPFLLERLGLTAWRRLLGTALAFAGIFLVLHGINRWAYQRDPAWAEFSEYNRMRGEIHVTPLEKFIPDAASAAGWSANDGWMFSKFYFSDPEVYAGVPKMRLFLDKLKMVAQAEPARPGNFPTKSLFLPSIFPDDARALMLLAMLNGVWCVLSAGAFRRRCLVTLLISYGLFVVLGSYLSTTVRLPERVAYNIPLFVNAICLYWATVFCSLSFATPRCGWATAFLAPRWRAKVLRWAALMLVAVWAAMYLSCVSELAYGLWAANTVNRNLERTSHKILGPVWSLLPKQKTPILIAMPFDSILEQSLFFCASAEKLPFFLVPSGWISHSPLFNQILEQHQLRPYSLSLVDREDIFFLMRTGWLEPLRIFYREHYGLNVRFDACLNTDGMPQFEDCHLHLYQAHAVGTKIPIGTKP
jgi:hypothetical protein